jgi:peptide/nickel transport system substrate-binding protein
MRRGRLTAAVVAGLATVIASGPADAQKSKDTLRIGFHDAISTVDLHDDPKPETSFTARAVFDPLIEFDPSSGGFRPVLAESWRRVDPVTLEFRLKPGIRFHDGSAFDADDVVHTVNWLADPNTKLRFRDNFSWIARAEKVDPLTVRVVAKGPAAFDMMRLAVSVFIYPSDIHSALADKTEFGRKRPVGTGPYKVAAVDSRQGVVLVKNGDYRHGGPWRPAASIGRVHALPIPDLQTQIAHLMTGGLDVVHEVPKDQAEALAAHPNLAATANQALVYFYMSMDAANRSGNAALANLKVRRALVQAIDRMAVAQGVVSGGPEVKPLDAVCLAVQQGCAVSVRPAPFDRAAAKRLLAEAGLPDGFDVEVNSIPGAQRVAEAIAGELRKIGVRAKVAHQTFDGYRKKQREGKLEILVAHYSSGGLPDVSAVTSFYFGNQDRDYWRDAAINEIARAGTGILDDAERREHYRKAFDRINEQAYIMPISTFPAVLIHTREVRIDKGSLSPGGADLYRMHWN